MKIIKTKRSLAQDDNAVHPATYFLGWLGLGVVGIFTVWYLEDYTSEGSAIQIIQDPSINQYIFLIVAGIVGLILMVALWKWLFPSKGGR